MNAIILSIGDELVLGQTVDTNSAWLSKQITAIGLTPIQHVTVSDSQNAIAAAIRAAVPQCDVLLISGGLGPTEDDLTRQALSDVMVQPLELSQPALENVERFFKALKRDMPPRNRIQAMIPKTAEMIENTNGTAPGIKAKLRHQGHARAAAPPTTVVYVVPGVPKEMKLMFERSILPELSKHAGGRAIVSKTLHTFGLGESAIAEKLGDLMRRDRNPSVGTTVSNGFVSLRLNSYFDSREKAQAELSHTESQCRAALAELIWGADEDSLPAVIGELLKSANKTIATAESCTGGLLAKYLTDVAGSSAVYERGWVTYSNDSKVNSLGIAQELLDEHGAVSEPVVEAMAIEAYLHSGAECALSISGIAGPGGATADKPVGTVCIGMYVDNADPVATTRTFIFHGDREMVRDRAAKTALTMLRFHLLGKTLPF